MSRSANRSVGWKTTRGVLGAWVLFSIAAMGAAPAPREARRLEYWVFTGGNDAEAGTREKPFRTLKRARDAVREARTRGLPQGGATVWIRGGVHRLDQTFELDRRDSGMPDAPVVYRSAPGEEVRLVGGTQVPSRVFQPVSHPGVLERLDPSARGKVLQADLKAAGITDFGKFTRRGGIERETLPAALELFFNDRPMRLAQWPNTGWT
ncbi:MAG: hypothetical protein NUV77_07030, partial [Thermoguttaceae bacterium]|nr:hypothetical protein [Thermoguttaceae bacterium]